MEKNKDAVEFGRATGLRHLELSLLRPEQIQKDNNGKVIIEINKGKYGPQSKGGKNRIVHVIEARQEHVWTMKEKAIAEGRATVFEKILNRQDEHSLRREYAQERYCEIEQKRENSGIKINNDYHTKDGTHRSYDREVLRSF